MHLRYAWYICRHKWFVFLACLRLGIPLAGIVHDLSKFRPSEWLPYARYFYGGVGGKGNRGGYPTRDELEANYHGGVRNLIPHNAYFGRLTKERVQSDFDRAWLAHQHRNPHHWQHYILREDNGATKPLPIPDHYRREMLADWRGAGRAAGRRDTAAWHAKNKTNITLHPETQAWLEGQLV